MRRSVRIASVLVAAALSVSAVAQEQSSGGGMHSPGGLYDTTTHTRSPAVSVWGIFGWWWGLGVGARYVHPLMADGFIDGINDSFAVEFGGDFHPFAGGILGYTGIAFDITAGGRWNFHLMPNLDLYGKLELGLMYESWGSSIGASALGLWWDVIPGLEYKFSEGFRVRAEGGRTGIRLGVTFAF